MIQHDACTMLDNGLDTPCHVAPYMCINMSYYNKYMI